MKRYNYNVYIDGEVEFVEDSNGKWVRYEDMKQAVECYNDWVERGIWKEDGCNCVIESEVRRTRGQIEFDDPKTLDWICPAHGYKRL